MPQCGNVSKRILLGTGISEGRMTHSALQLTHHGIELGLKWLIERDTKKSAPRGNQGHNLIKLLCKLNRERQRSLYKAYNWHMHSPEVDGEKYVRSPAKTPIPTLYELLEKHQDASFTSRYAMESGKLEDMALKALKELVQGYSYEEIIQRSNYFLDEYLVIAFSAVIKVVCSEFPSTDDPSQDLHPPVPEYIPELESGSKWVGSAKHELLECTNLHFQYGFFSDQLKE